MKVDGACVWEVWLLGNVLLGCLIVRKRNAKKLTCIFGYVLARLLFRCMVLLVL
jgi:hypothetical protein